MNGFLLIDKPEGITSFYCVKVLRKVTGVRRIGFAGTLDPLATGLMIVAVGEVTKLLTFLEKLDKTYEVTIHLGAVSNTYDAQGKMQEVRDGRKPARSQIVKILEDEFLGEREQMPPIFSAIKIQGRRAYDLARKGITVELKKRPVHFFELKVRSYAWPFLKLRVHCGSGTYIRSLAHDLGQKLGCGGYVEELRRTKIGLLNVKNAVPLNEIDAINVKRHFVLPQDFFSDWQQLNLSDHDYGVLAHGGFIANVSDFAPLGAPSSEDLGQARVPILALYKGQCVGVLEILDGKLKFHKKLNII